MKIKFYATANTENNNSISGETVNGIDLSEIPNSTKIRPLPEELKDAGIVSVEINDVGELFVILNQPFVSYEYPTTEHYWKQSPWIPAEEFDPIECYIIPMSVQDKMDYEMVFRDTVETLPSGVEVPRKGWTVVQLVPDEPELDEPEEEIV